MSVRREVVTLSQLLRRNENSNSRRRGHAPPLPSQSSAGSRTTERPNNSTPFTDGPATTRYQPLTFTQRVRDANRESTSQPEMGVSSQTSGGFPLSQEVYAPESDQLSAITSMSQSSFSQTQSQNLLGSSQDDQLHRLQQWQIQQTQLPPPPSPSHCTTTKKFQEVEDNLKRALVEQTREQKQHQTEMLARYASPINKSMEDIGARLTTSTEDHSQHRTAITELADSVKSVAASVTGLHQQSLENKTSCEEIQKAVESEAVAVKEGISKLQARFNTVEGAVKSCSDLVTRVLEQERLKHEALMSAVKAYACHCPQDVGHIEDTSKNVKATRKRRRVPYRLNTADTNLTCYTSSPSTDSSPARTNARSVLNYGFDARFGRYMEENDADFGDLHRALDRIEAIRAKRRSYLNDL